MSNTLHGVLVLLVTLCLCPAAYGEPDSKDVQDAELRFSIQMTSALNNDPKAQFLVAEMYEQGAGTPQNLRMAHLWYTKSANQKYAPAIAKLASWGGEKKQTEAAQARAEEQKRRQAEAEAAAATAAKAAQARAEEQKRRQAEAEAAAATAAKASQARAEEQKRRQAEAEAAAVAAIKAAQAAETAPVAKEKPSETSRPKDKPKSTADKNAGKADAEFKANPCKTPTAKFTSTCQ